jgi:hypothetical protein
MKMGLYANINAKRNRIKAQKAAGKTPERMKKPGSKGAPTKAALRCICKDCQANQEQNKVKGVKHYLPNGTEWKGGTHKMGTALFTGKEHSKTSKKLVHFKDLKRKK